MSERSSDLSLVTTRPIDPQLSHMWSTITEIRAERRLAGSPVAFFGLIAGSFALQAFGWDSLIELISGIAVLTGLRKECSPSSVSGEHNKRVEKFTSGLLFALIPVIGLGAIYSYITGLSQKRHRSESP